MASSTAMMNRETCQWDELAVQAAAVDPATLVPINPTTEPLDPVRGEWATRWPALAQTPWYSGWGDGACANVGSGGTGPNRIALTVGTSGAVRMVRPVSRVGDPPEDLWTYRVDAERAVVGAAISNGGKVPEWLAELTGSEIGDDDWHAAADQEIDTHGLTMLPFLAGERAPIWNDWATGAVVGMRLATTRADLIRAGMEAVTWRLALLYRSLAGQAEPQHEIVANGGAILRSQEWLQLLADSFEHPIIALPPDEEASARGAALLALQAAGVIGSLDEAADPARDGRVIEPNPERYQACEAAIERQERLRRAIFGADGKPVV
jgi:gluconokinase